MGDNKDIPEGENDDNDAFNEVLMTIRSRRAKQTDSGTSESRASRKTEKSETSIKKRKKRKESVVSEVTIPLSPEEEEKQAQELLNEIRITNRIRERLHARRQKKREEKIRMMESRGATTRNSNSSSTVSTESSESATIRRQRRAWKRSKLPFSVVCDQLRQFMTSEESLQKEFLQTIRILRGGEVASDAEEEEYLSQTVSPLPEIDETATEVKEEVKEKEEIEEEANEEIKQDEKATPTEPADNEEKAEVKIKKRKRITCKIDSRWPKGHKLHTKSNDERKRVLSSLKNALFLSNYIYAKSLERMTPIQQIQKHRTKRQELLDYEQWRENMMKIAYDEEFSKGKDKMFIYVPLPEIGSHSTRTPESSRTRVSYSERDKTCTSCLSISNSDVKNHSSEVENTPNSEHKHSFKTQKGRSLQRYVAGDKRTEVYRFGMYDTSKYKSISKRKTTPSTEKNKRTPVEEVEFRFKSQQLREEEQINGSEEDKVRSEEDKVRSEEDNVRSEEDKVGSEEDNVRSEEDKVRSEEDNVRSEEDKVRSEEDNVIFEKDKVADKKSNSNQEKRVSRESTDSAINEPSTHSNESYTYTPDVNTSSVYIQRGNTSPSKNTKEMNNGIAVSVSIDNSQNDVEIQRILMKSPDQKSISKLVRDLQDHVRTHPGHIRVLIEAQDRDNADQIVNSIKKSQM